MGDFQQIKGWALARSIASQKPQRERRILSSVSNEKTEAAGSSFRAVQVYLSLNQSLLGSLRQWAEIMSQKLCFPLL